MGFYNTVWAALSTITTLVSSAIPPLERLLHFRYCLRPSLKPKNRRRHSPLLWSLRVHEFALSFSIWAAVPCSSEQIVLFSFWGSFGIQAYCSSFSHHYLCTFCTARIQEQHFPLLWSYKKIRVKQIWWDYRRTQVLYSEGLGLILEVLCSAEQTLSLSSS